jgi:hypothetical protein
MAGSSGGRTSARELAMAAARSTSSSEARASGEGQERVRALYIEIAAPIEEVRHVAEEGVHGVHAWRPHGISSSM